MTSFLAIAALGCSSDYAIGDLAQQSLFVEPDPIAPGDPQTGATDFQLAPLLSSADVTLPLRGFGQHAIGVGDVDGDGFDDFAVTGFDVTTLIAYVHLRYGGPAPIDAEDALALAESGARFAFEENSPAIEAIGPAGDINGDGFADLLVTATVCEELLPSGGAYLLYGGSERQEGVKRIGDVATHLKLPFDPSARGGCGTPSGVPLGIGDIDGDGLSDFMLVSYQSPDYDDPAQIDDPTRTTGYLFYGREAPLASDTTWFDADATIVAEQYFRPLPLGDVTADGRADFTLGAELGKYYVVPGSSQRLSGLVDTRTAFAELDCPVGECAIPPLTRAGDVDGDGVDDVLLYEAHNRAYLFYGAPGLLDRGVPHVEDAAASFIDDLATPRELLLSPAGDRDGDGDADLLSLFFSDAPLLHADVAFISGSSTRVGGTQALPIQEAIAARPGGLPFSVVIESQNHTFAEPDRVVSSATDAGDLNGDGADDLLTTSLYRVRSDENGSSFGSPELHIHYGTPGGTSAASIH